MKQYDVVTVTKDFPEYGLVKEQVGTILEAYDNYNFEVEFCDEKGYTLYLGTFKREYLVSVQE